MRINKYVALATGLSRRAADATIAEGRITINGQKPGPGDDVTPDDVVALDDRRISAPVDNITIVFNKPTGYVVSREGQGSKTIYDILPTEYHNLKPVGRLDKDSSGLLLLTNDGQLAHDLTHPSRQKTKVYRVRLNKPLQPIHQQMISDHGIQLKDGRSQFSISSIDPAYSTSDERSKPEKERSAFERSDESTRGRASLSSKSEPRRAQQAGEKANSPSHGPTPHYQVTMHEGRNRQIRRTFVALGYQVTELHRTHFGPYVLGNLQSGEIRQLTADAQK